MAQSSVILTGFADEAAHPCDQSQKAADRQFAVFAALGLQYYSIRFIDVDGNGSKNVMKLTKQEIKKLNKMHAEYGLGVSSIGSPIGKVKLLDVEDGTKNAYIPFDKYLKNDVQKACDLANAFGSKLLRGFSFYHPKGTDAKEHMAQSVDQLGQIADLCDSEGLTFGLEVEPNLVGENGYLLAELHKKVNHPALVTIFDAANIVVQGYSSVELLDQLKAMLPGLGWLHIKDYSNPKPVKKGEHVNEDMLANFVPSDQGDAGHEALLREFGKALPKIERRMKKRGVPGIFLDLEPHVKGGGQFGGFSGPDGMGVAFRALCRALDYVGIGYHLRDFEDVKAARGF